MDIVIKYDLFVIMDEIYVELIYDEEFIFIVFLEGMKEWIIIISGFFKGFVMIGWCFGYICVLIEIVKVMLKIY